MNERYRVTSIKMNFSIAFAAMNHQLAHLNRLGFFSIAFAAMNLARSSDMTPQRFSIAFAAMNS